MGVIRFRNSPTESFDDFPEVYQAYLRGFDGRVFSTHVSVENDVVSFQKISTESAKLNVAWPVKGLGKPVMRTTTLPEKEEPYLLPIELARGKIALIREQLGFWDLKGFQISEEIAILHQEAFRLFLKSVSLEDDISEACLLANQAIEKSCSVAELMTQAYASQTLAKRMEKTTRLPASLGCHLGESVPSDHLEEIYCESFDVAVIPVEWKNIETNEGKCNWDVPDKQLLWCKNNRLLVHGGPLLDLSPSGLPEWLWKWEKDFHSLQSIVCDFVETALTRYYGNIRQWEISARVSTGGALALTEEDRLSLVARTLEVARQVDDDLRFNIRIDQPWGEYQARGQHRLSPMQFVDALARSGLGLSGVSLELGIGYRPCGSYSYDLLDFSRLIDLWSLLNLPLTVILAFPSEVGVDPLSCSDLEVEKDFLWKSPWNASSQAKWLNELLPVLLSKEAVVRVEWAHLTDQSRHYFPHAGLVDSEGVAKPSFEKFRWYHQSFWQSDSTTSKSD